jgi:beta-glucuronidase
MMKYYSLNGMWKCIPDLKGVGLDEGWFSPEKYAGLKENCIEVSIPSSFNLIAGYESFEGIFWYYHEFKLELEELKDFSRIILQFSGVNYCTEVWLNGIYIGHHEGGFTQFTFHIGSSALKELNILVIKTDNVRRKGQVPDLIFDWMNWGGIYRPVALIFLKETYLENMKIKSILKKENEAEIEISFKKMGPHPLKLLVLEDDKIGIVKQMNIKLESGKCFVNINLKNPKLWSLGNPYLYYLKIISTTNNNETDTLYFKHFGIRQVEVVGRQILFNKHPIFIKGVGLHEEMVPYGRTIPLEARERDIRAIKRMGLNTIRTAHYSHDESLLDLADKLGILILEEIPIWGNCDFKSEKTFKLAAKMLWEMINRDINHPSVIWWSVANEIPIERPHVSKFIKKLMEWARKLDDSRIITYVSYRIFSDLIRRYADVATINFYFGWYFGNTKLINLFLDIMRTSAINKPWVFTEFGAGAKYGFRAPWRAQEMYSEEFQLNVLDHSIRTFNSKPYLSGWMIWNYRDFRSFTRQNKYQEGYNRKGIVSEKNEKKLIAHHLPKIINQEKRLVNTQGLGMIIWMILFPFVLLLTFTVIYPMITFVERKMMEIGKLKELTRLKQSKS